MALELAAETIGAAAIESLRRRRSWIAEHAEQALVWLRDTVEPPPGLELRSQDGSTYTGILIMESSRPVLLLAVRHPPGRQPERAPVLTPPPSPSPRPLYGQERVYGRDRIDPDAPFWDRDSTPYGR